MEKQYIVKLVTDCRADMVELHGDPINDPVETVFREAIQELSESGRPYTNYAIVHLVNERKPEWRARMLYPSMTISDLK